MTKVTRQDIESKLREVQTRIGEDVEQARPSVVRIATVVAVGVIVVVYMLGRRRGRLRSTVVEVRRV